MDEKDLISRSAVIKLIREMEGSYTPAAFAAKVTALFAGDAEPVQHGVWEWYEDWCCIPGEVDTICEEYGWRCSVCGVSLADSIEEAIGERPDLDDPDKVPTMKRCPNCDAKMTGARELGADGAGVGCEADKEDVWE